MRISLTRKPWLFWLVSDIRRRWKSCSLVIADSGTPPRKQLLVDVSTIVRSDVRSGIQRVVRAILGQLIAQVGDCVTVQPIFASRNHGFCLAEVTSEGKIIPTLDGDGKLIAAKAKLGDVYLGLDLTASILPHVERQIGAWRKEGVGTNFLVYDLLPYRHPEWFDRKTVRNFRRWLDVIGRQSDRCLCISDVVAAHLRQVFHSLKIDPLPDLETIPMGSDLSATFPTKGMPIAIRDLRRWFRQYRVLLCVGTLEPRKGYDIILDAFTTIWSEVPGSDLALLFVGRPGWKTRSLQQEIREKAVVEPRLRWIEDATDELLEEIYASSHGMVAGSFDEGFGLPIIEALRHALPILARDIPVFREVGGSEIDYFGDDKPRSLASRVILWAECPRKPSGNSRRLTQTWADSASRIIKILAIEPAGKSA